MSDFNVFRLGDAIGAGQNLAMNQYRLNNAMTNLQAQGALRAATQAGTLEAMKSYAQQFPEQAMEYQTKADTAQANKIALASHKLAFVGQVTSGMTDQASYENGLKQLKDAGIDMSSAPAQYDPAWVKQGMEQSLTVKQRLDNQLAMFGRQMQMATLAETQRHHGVIEKQGQEKVDLQKGEPAVIEAGAKALADYTGPVPSAFALKSPIIQKQLARAIELNPNYDVATHQTVQKAMKDFGTGKQGNTVRSFNVGLTHLDTLGKLADALNNGDTQLINKISNAVATQTGSTAPTNFEAAKKIVGDEIVKAIVGAGGGVADREDMAKQVSAANTPAQLKGVINTFKELMVGQLGGLEQQYESSTKRKDFADKYLSPEARDLYQKKKQAAVQSTGVKFLGFE